MQDRYIGDVGDFGKFGLLRLLCGQDSTSRLSLGVVWYRVENESHNDDGKHWTYLLRDSKHLRSCDSELYDGLNRLLVQDGKVVNDYRNVARIESSGLLPAGTRFFSDSLSYQRVNFQDRLRAKGEWLDRALDATVHADIVFLDPDNGIECESVKKTAKKAPKYVFWDDITAFATRNQTVVVYHHLNHLCPAPEQVKKLSQKFQSLFPRLTIEAVVFKRGTLRAYFIAAPADKCDILISRLCNVLRAPWSDHFRTFSLVLTRRCAIST